MLLFLHADIILSSYTIEDLLDELMRDPSVGAVTALATRDHKNKKPFPYLDYHDWDGFAAAAQDIRLKGRDPHPVLFAEMYALLVRRDAVAAAAFLDERYTTPFLAALDYTVRFTQAGWEIKEMRNIYVHHEESIHAQEMAAYDKIIAQERRVFREKWGLDLDYSFIVRYDLIPLIDVTREGAAILEIGCACGGTLREIGRQNPTAQLYGVELNEKAAALARPFAEILSMNVESLDPADIPIRFDDIIMGDVIEHLLDPWHALSNMRALLKPGGCLVASIPNVMHISNLFNMLRGFWSYQDSGLLDRTHFRFFTRHEILEMFEKGGFEVEQIKEKQIDLPDFITALRTELLALKTITVHPEDLDAYQWLVRARRS